ncbi:NAD-dependent epimerase/dehydratase family protein [Flavobacteriaceae bacterium]|nr:NAD-dependent epimerase/dehydratase family protein [Flavobacteriaceae bacterium]MDB9910673.1 NAD-dependent epimerase/dehydratase family protein [Flavobacteriaceae bacterium]
MILVTGATGLVGSHLLLKLIEQDRVLVALYRSESKKNSTLDFLKERTKSAKVAEIIWRKGDVCNQPSLAVAFEGITHLYHCAAFISFAHYKQETLMEVNQQGTTNLVNLAIKHQLKKIAYISSIAALGSDTTSDSIDESTPWNADQDHTPYAYSKFGAELEVWRATQEGVPAVIVNPGVILGTGVEGNPLELLCNQIDNRLLFYPKGATGYVTVEDVVQVLTNLMDSETKNERFILVAENWSYEQMLRRIALIRKKRPPKIGLRKSWLQVAWGFEGILSLFGKRRFMTQALISSLCDVKHIQGNRIIQESSFKYSGIEAYLIEHATKKD